MAGAPCGACRTRRGCCIQPDRSCTLSEITDRAASDPYRILGVDPQADGDAIQAAYRRLARRFHPDLSSDPGAEQRMAEINVAFAILRDSERRATWDKEHARKAAVAEARPLGHVYDPYEQARVNGPASGGPQGNGSGTVLSFGRYEGWTLGEIARVDVEYLEWLARAPGGRQFRNEIVTLLGQMGRPAASGLDPLAGSQPSATTRSTSPLHLGGISRRLQKRPGETR